MAAILALLLLFAIHPAAATPGALWQPLSRVDPVPRIYRGVPTGAYPAVGGIIIVLPDAVALCSGTLVAPDVVLTAAHCVDGEPTRIVAAFFPDGATEEDHDAAAFAINPDYNPGRLAVADIALIRLASPVPDVAPMPLPSAAPRPRRAGVIVGFGRDQSGMVGVKEMATVHLQRCPAVFPAAGLARGQLRSSLCWRPHHRGQDTCEGDSGGPLVVDGAVAGVTSGGYPQCPGRLSWDTNVALYRPWIESLLGP